MKHINKSVLFLIILSIASWGRLLFLEGLWGDDWAWVWQYFGTDSYREFIYPWQSVGHTLDGSLIYTNLCLLDYFKENTTWILNIIRFFMFTINGLIIFFIFKKLMRYNTILPETIGAIYLVSPIVNILWILQMNRTLFLLAYLLSVLLTVIILNKDKFQWFYYVCSIILMTFAIFGLESFIFIEMLRPIIIYYLS